ncbi:tetratricopeptide repeat protein [Actinomadura nitritigenes]|uniref:tetratricopeptide repeat protein n=1 Tax=Actinomadura nitritigenes TaxID=134602 RepID=UPI00367A56D6
MRRERAAETFARRQDGAWELGSGYLIARRLVLTAAHAVLAGGAPAATIMVRFLGDRGTLPGRVAWWRCDETVDAAVVEIDDPDGRAPDAAPVSWGRLTGARGAVRCEAIGFPDALRGPDEVRDSEHLTGVVNPGTRAKARRHDVLVDGRPESAASGSAWAGISGAALFCGDLLTGVIVADPAAFGGRRLTAVPVAEFLNDAGFTALVGDHHADSVELSGLFEPAGTPGPATPSPAYLLRADAEIVPFHGRTELLEELSAWCDRPDPVSAWLVTGPGGQGKTRLAREFTARRRAAGWAVGSLGPDEPGPSELDRLAESAVPVLVVVDYAETRVDQVQRLAVRVGSAQGSGLRVRLLLLARHAGEWWRQLVTGHPVVERTLAQQVTPLPPLGDTAGGRAALFTTAAEHFAQALRRRGEHVGSAPPAPPPDLDDPRYGSVLTVHMTALVALLQAGADPVPTKTGETVEEVLLRHEERYWTNTATARGLRFAYSKTLPRAVAVATLFSVATEADAAHLLGRVPGLRDQPEERRLALAEWLHDLYPPADGRYWGHLQPDRLGEHLLARITADGPHLFDDLFAEASRSEAQHAFEVLSRAAVLQPAAAAVIAQLVSRTPALAAVAAVAATRSEHPGPLIRAIEPLIDRITEEPQWLRELIAVTWAAPSLFGRWSITASRRLVERYTRLASEDPAYRPELASHLFGLAERLNAVGEVREALDTLRMAVSVWEETPDGPAKTAGLAPALGLLAGLYSQLGRTEDALWTLKKSVRLWERLDPPDHAGTVQALSNLSAVHNDAGDKRASLETAERALEVYRKVEDPDPWLTIIATSAGTNKANRLVDLGLREEGLAIHREVVATRRRVTENHPVLFDADLASGLHNLAKMLHRAGENDEALLHISESVEIYRRLAMRLPAIYLRNVADTVLIQGEILFRLPGRLRAAVDAMVEAEEIAKSLDYVEIMAAAFYVLERARRSLPEVKQYAAESRKRWRAEENSDEERPHRRDRPAPRTVRNQPKRTSRRKRKNT